jgi:hypothetical protein
MTLATKLAWVSITPLAAPWFPMLDEGREFFRLDGSQAAFENRFVLQGISPSHELFEAHDILVRDIDLVER